MTQHPEVDTGLLDDDRPEHSISAVLDILSFRRLWLALGLSSLGDWLGLLATTAMAASLADQSYAGRSLAVSGVLVLRLAPAVLLGPIAGVLADRVDRRILLVVGDLARAALFVSIVVVGTLPWLYGATVLVECFALLWLPAKDATVPTLVPARRLQAANQLSLTATYGTAPVAAALYAVLALGATALHALTGVPWLTPVTFALALNALSFVVSGLTIAFLPLPPRDRSAVRAEGSVISSVIVGWRYVGRTRVVRGLVAGMLGAFAAGGVVIGLGQVFVDDLGAGQPGFGVLFGAVFVGLAAGMWAGPRLLRGLSRRRMFPLALMAAGASLVLLALIAQMVMAAVLTLVLGFWGGVAWVCGYTLLGQLVDDEVRGRTFAFVQSAARVVLVAVLAAAPALAGLIGRHQVHLGDTVLQYNGAAWVFLIAGLLVTALGSVALREMDDRAGTPWVSDLQHALADEARPLAGTSDGLAEHHGGYFIAFEGGDGAGKSTQARMLQQWLESELGHEVVLTREPGATALGRRLREVLLRPADEPAAEEVGPRAEALLFAADRAHHVATLIAPALQRGAVVVTDRFMDSSIAYQGAGRSLDPHEIERISRWATGDLVPDLTVLLDVPPEFTRIRRVADAARSGEDRLETLPDTFHARVRAHFLDLARREPHRYLVLDGSETREELQRAIRARLREVLPVSARRRAEVSERLADEDRGRVRRAEVEADVRRLDAELRGRGRDELRARTATRDRLRAEAEAELAGGSPVATATAWPEPFDPDAAPTSEADLEAAVEADTAASAVEQAPTTVEPPEPR